MHMNSLGTATEEARAKRQDPSTFESIFYPNGKALAVLVPDYQRAFAWKLEQIDLFIEDLQKYESKTGYYFGHFILEQKSDEEWEVVDGQQRLTTFVLFLMVCRVLAPAESPAVFDMVEKFSTVSYDVEAMKAIGGNPNGYFTAGERFDAKKPPNDDHIVKGLGLIEGKFTRSQRRMVLALLRFHQAFQEQELKLEKISKYIGVILKSLCSHHLTMDKTVAVSIFEMHNTRGIPLSTLEIIKAKLMKYVYDNGESAERRSMVEQIQREFGEIYCMEEQLATRSFRGKMTMEQLLRLHLRVVDDGTKKTAQRFDSPALGANADALVEYVEMMLHFTDTKKTTGKNSKSGVDYALKLASEFKKSVYIVCETLPTWDDEDQLVGDVLILDSDLSCQFFLIICRLMESCPDGSDGRLSNESLRLWEKLLFTRDFHGAYYRLSYDNRDNFRGLFQKCFEQSSRIVDVLQGFLANGFRPDVTRGLQSIVLKYLTESKDEILRKAFWWHWRPKLNYVLYKYEVSASSTIRDVMKGTISVEHILPQNWKWEWVEREDVPPKTLSESEREDVQKKVDSYIHGLGNLMLLTRSENSGQGDEHPAKKRYGRAGGSYGEHDQNWRNWESSKNWPELISARGEKIFKFMIETLVGGSECPKG